jgi:thiol-disulfide isomerase/thioredoxin
MSDGSTETKREGTSEGRTWLVVIALAAGFALVPRLTRGCEGSLASNEAAPDFSAKIVANGENPTETTLSLASLQGKPVLLDFWATWCGPCQAELPVVNGIAQRFKDRGLVVVGVNTSDEPGMAEAYARKKRLSFPIVYDTANEVAKKYRVDNLPTLVIVSKEGKIVAVRHGITSDSDLDGLVRSVL